jgi:3-phenylpropionate/trans-cinnamate dioxygenase ferredoxin subunit
MSVWVVACQVGDIDAEDVLPFSHGGVDYALYRAPDDHFYATAGHCTHERQLLCDGLVMGSVIECPKHNGRFDYRTGQALGAPVLVDLSTFPVKVDAGTVYMQIG